MAGSSGSTDPQGVRILPVEDLDGLRALATLFDLLWQRSTPAIPLELFRALTYSGNYAAAAFQGDRLVGGLAGFLGWHEDHHALHSHILGVVPEAQGRGVGTALKLHQRAWAHDRGLATILWTFDPLVQRNARFNLVRLGARAVGYLPDFYGPMEDRFNAGVPTDRLLVAWPTSSDVAPPGEPERGDAAVALGIDDRGRPVVAPLEGPLLACATPPDIVALRRADPKAAGAWSAALRATLGAALAAGYEVLGLDAAGAYLLRR
jgi:predicted GNAT superfamily acetyltransferase